MCESGCKNYHKKWGCPPYSRNFTEIKPKLKHLFIISLKVNTNVFSNTARQYFRLTRAEVILKRRTDKLIRGLEELTPDSYCLINGSCKVCQKCNGKLDLPCSHPDLMRPSLESTGVDCDFIANKFFGLHLLWYKNKTAPEYLIHLAGLLTNNNPEEEFKKIVANLK